MLLADPQDLQGIGSNHEISEDEQSRRERVREVGSGIVAFSSSADSPNVCFTSDGTLYAANLDSREITSFETVAVSYTHLTLPTIYSV